MLIDTHCHIHESDYPIHGDDVIERAHNAGVMQMICIGTNISDSQLAIDFASKYDGVFASIGVHPHYADEGVGRLNRLFDSIYSTEHQQKLVAIGEIGLDYHYSDSPSPENQSKLLKQQIEFALKHDLPIIFHVREAYDDFWEVLDNFKDDGRQIRGVLHCFTDTIDNLNEGLRRGFYISINGISTFTKDNVQKKMFASIPIDKLLLETDAPWLTPNPLRGKAKTNEPAYVREIAEFNSTIYNLSFDEIADATTANARKLFKL